jgi:DNA-binding NarL/FixJ family response regulator
MMNADAAAVNLASSLRVVVASCRDMTRSRVRTALERVELAVVAECSDGASATAAVVRHRADVCLVDALLPGAWDAVAAIASLPLAPRVVVLDSRVDEHAFFRVVETGAVGYLLEDVDPGRLGDELRSIAEGGVVVASAVARRLVEKHRRGAPRRVPAPADLTDREWQVLELLADGLTTKEIALRLRVSSTAIRRHLSSAVKRIGAMGALRAAP